jgi:hypothetical protein
MLILLPIMVFIVIYISLLGGNLKWFPELKDWRKTFLMTSIFWGTLVIIITEGLGLVKGLSSSWVIVVWTIMVAISIGVGWSSGAFRRARASFQLNRDTFTAAEWLILLGLISIVITLTIVAWISPPNTTDSLLYHMPRIAHWIQNGSLEHYSTAYSHQLWASPFAEISILQLRLLYGDGQPGNMVQWFSMVGSIIAASAIACLMGVNRKGQFITAAFAISIPMGILQSTSTQTDYVTAFWILCLVYFVVLSKQRPLQFIEWLCLSLATGLGMLTKGTFYPYAFPILLWFFIPLLFQEQTKKVILKGLGFALVVIVLNLGFWVRNINTFGGPLGSSETVQQHAGVSLDPQVWISALVKQVGLNLPVPWENINTSIISTVRAIDESLGAKTSDFDIIWLWNHEDLAGNPIHLLIILISIPAIAALTRKSKIALPLRYTLVVLGMFFMHAISVDFHVYDVRYQLPFFLAAAPLIGVAFTQSRLQRIGGFTTFTFLFISLPWVLFNSTRPILAMRNAPEPWSIPCTDTLGCTRSGSIFTRNKEDIFFANLPNLKGPLASMAETISDASCEQVGLRIDSHDPEYPFWWLLGAPESGTRIETIYSLPELDRYQDPSFNPCAIICTICGDRPRIHGLDRVNSFDEISLYMGSDYSKDPDG